MGYFAREHLLESFARRRGVPKEDVVLVDARFRQVGDETEVTLVPPLEGAATVNGGLGKAISGVGSGFVINAFEKASGRTVRPRGWMMAFHDRREGQPEGEASGTYILALYPQYGGGYHPHRR